MDYLQRQVFDSITSSRTGDEKIDSANLNLSKYILGALSNYEKAIDGINSKKSHFTPKGLADQKEKAREKVIKDMDEVWKKSTWKRDIDEVQKKFDVLGERDPIEVLIQEGRQRETRQFLREYKDDIGKMAIFQKKILEGDPIAVGAVQNSPFEFIEIDPNVMKIGIEKMRLRKNPFAADRLKILNQAQEVFENLQGFFKSELGGSGDDPIKELASK